MGALSTTVVISQFQIAGTTAADEFIELHNVSGNSVDLNGLTLVYRAAAGVSDVTLTSWSASTVVPAGGYYLVGATLGYDGSPAADSTYVAGSTGKLSGTSGGLAIRSGAADTGTVVDSLGYGTATNAFVEGTTTTAPAANNSGARKNGGCLDNDTNSTDFETLAPSAPRNSSTTPMICGGASPTPTPTPSPTASPTPTPTPSPSATPSPAGTITGTYTLPDTPISQGQPGIANPRGFNLGGIGSDLWHQPGDPADEFWMITDRGPNGQIKVSGANRRTFPVPDFDPVIVHVRLVGTDLMILQIIPILTTAGGSVTGLPNLATHDETPYDYTAQTPLDFNVNGIDSEGLIRIADGTFWVAEEYGPSLLHIAANGKVIKRWTPVGIELPGAGYPVSATLPEILGKRKINRGFEGLGLSPDGKTLFAIVQSPLSNPDKATGESSRLTRIITFDIATETVTGEYVYQFESGATFDPQHPAQDEMKSSALIVIDSKTLLVEERTDWVTRLYLVDLTGATSILGGTYDNASTSPSLEALTAPYPSSVPVLPKTLRVDLAALSGVPGKIEGVALVDCSTLAIANDNDFDIGNVSSGTNVGTGAKSVLQLIKLDAPITPTCARIHDIQGAAHLSPFNTKAVRDVPGIVTGLRTNGFYMQDPSPDTDDKTSEGIFVFTSTAPTVSVGNAVLVSGAVSEFRPGSSTGPGLTVTQIGGTPTITLVSAVNTLPTTTTIGAGGRVPPTTVIEDDATGSPPSVENGGTFDPAQDGLDFYESLEGMLVQVNNAVAVGPTSDFGSNRELPVIPDGGTGFGPRTTRGGIVIQPGDFNPERIILNDNLNGVALLPLVNVGDGLGNVTGIIDYAFNNFKLQVLAVPTRTDNGLLREATTVEHTMDGLTVATFNVENLDPSDGNVKFSALASIVVNNLKLPDIIALEEIQDNNGATNDGLVDANGTFQQLIAAIKAASITGGNPNGVTYEYRQINPVDDQDGGEPGGNIRVGFLFRTDRGVSFVDRAGGCSVCAVDVLGTGSTTQLSYSPGRIEPTNSAFNSSRKPLAGEFRFNGRSLFVIANHFNSKGSDQPLFGRFQPPTLGSEVQRKAQAQLVHDFVQKLITADANAKVVVLGDINDFQFSDVAGVLTAGGILTSLMTTLPVAEQYSYVFEGNSQTLDQILVSPNLITQFPNGGTGPYDVVHVNAEFADQVSDHDPQVARFTLTPPAPTAGNLSIATPEDVSLTIALNGTAANGGTLTYTIVAQPQHGTLGVVSGNGVTYTPAANYSEPDSFTYKVTENGLDSGTATVTLTVGAVNDLPVATNGDVSTPEDTGITITLNATDVEGSTLAYTIVAQPQHGTLGTLNGNTVVYMPNNEYSGPDSFTFRVNDGAADSNVATVSITVTPVNDPPVALNGSATTAEDTAVAVTLGGSDVEGATLTYAIINGPAHGMLGAVSGNGVTYTPAANFSGTDTFTFRANDGASNSMVAVITITVTPVNDAPTATEGAVTTAGNTALDLILSGNDVDGDALSYAIVGSPTHGTLGAVTGNRITYIPAPNYSGPDSFTFRANDGTANSNTATITITVAAPATPSYTLTTATSGAGSVTPGTSTYTAGQAATIAATPNGGAVFIGWTVDGAFVGFANPLTIGMNANHTVSAAFAPAPAFGDVSSGTPYNEAITRLAARGIIRGFEDGSFGPDLAVKRAESAALIARAMGWDAEDHGNNFIDRCDPVDPNNCIDANLWRNVGTLAFYDVARGFPGGEYRPRDEVAQVQVISFVTRAMVAKGYWIAATTDDASIYPNVSVDSGHRLDLVTFVRYAGAIPNRPVNQNWADWTNSAPRGWYAGVLDQALRSRFVTTP